MQVNISKKTVIILVAAFLATGLVTTLVGVFQEDKESEEQVDKKGTSDGHFRQRDQDREEGASDEEKKPFSVEKPLENDPYEELQSLIGLESVKEEVRTLANFAKVQKMRADKSIQWQLSEEEQATLKLYWCMQVIHDGRRVMKQIEERLFDTEQKG